TPVVERSGRNEIHAQPSVGADLSRPSPIYPPSSTRIGNPPESSIKRGLGLAASAYICGAGKPIYWNNLPHSAVQIRLDRGGGVTVYCGSTDIGQGSTSVLAYIVAEELGIAPEEIHMETADTALTPVDLGSYSSRVTFMAGNAAIAAAHKLKEQLFAAVSQRLHIPVERLQAEGGMIY